MRTVVESPQARLRREMGWSPARRSVCVGDWLKFSCGDHVCEKGGRHCGRVEAIGSFIVKVRWEGTGWLSWIHLDDLERVRP